MVQEQAPNGDVGYTRSDLADRVGQVNVQAGPYAGTPPPFGQALGAESDWTWDPANHRTDYLDFGQREHPALYDGDGRLTSQTDTLLCPSCPPAPQIVTAATDDPDGNVLTLIREEAGTTTATWGGAYNADDWLSMQNDGAGLVAYGYDQAGRLRFETAPGITGSVWTTVDAAGRATAISDTLAGLPSQQSTITYYPTDRPYTTTLDAGGGSSAQVVEARQYDGDNRLTCVTALGPGGAAVPVHLGYSYGISAQGVITTVSTFQGAAACGGGGSIDQTLGHDALGRLVAATGGAGTSWAWGYDGNGNLATEVVTASGTGVGQPTLYSYANLDGSAPGGWLPNEVLTTTDGLSLTDGTLRQAFAYDGVGNTTVITTGAYNGQPQAVRRLAYNAQGLLSALTTTVAGAPVLVEAIGYDALGRRRSVAVTDSAPPWGGGTAAFTETLRYRGRGRQVSQVAVREGTTSFTETFLYRPSGAPLELVYQKQGQGAQRYWYLLDGQGSVTGLVDASGSLAQQYSYDPWGQPTGATGTLGIDERVPQPLRYRGYWFDGWYDGAGAFRTGPVYISDDTRPQGWYWLQARAYDPALRRFLQPDPSARDGVRSYAYVHDDPVDLADPSGLAGRGTNQPAPGQLPLPLFEEGAAGGVPSVDVTAGGAEPAASAATPELPPAVDAAGAPSAETEFNGAATTASGGATTDTSPSADTANTTSTYNREAAIKKARIARRWLGRIPSGKTVAATATGVRTLSGWGKPAIRRSFGFGRSVIAKVVEQAGRMGFTFAEHFRDLDFPGQYFASHSEPQLAEAAPNEPFATSTAMCSECQRYFTDLAQSRGVPQVVADPDGVRVFYPNGRTEWYPG